MDAAAEIRGLLDRWGHVYSGEAAPLLDTLTAERDTLRAEVERAWRAHEISSEQARQDQAKAIALTAEVAAVRAERDGLRSECIQVRGWLEKAEAALAAERLAREAAEKARDFYKDRHAEVGKWLREAEELATTERAAKDTAERALAEAREALQPFAEAAEFAHGMDAAEEVTNGAVFEGRHRRILVSHLRAAWAALTPPAPGGGEAKAEWQPTHRHYKGGLYKLLFTATHSETDEQFAIYEGSRAMSGQDAGEVFHRWARPLPMFNDTLPDGRRRFEPLARLPGGQQP